MIYLFVYLSLGAVLFPFAIMSWIKKTPKRFLIALLVACFVVISALLWPILLVWSLVLDFKANHIDDQI